MQTQNIYYLFDPKNVQNVAGATLTQGAVKKIVTNAVWVDQHNGTSESNVPNWEHRVYTIGGEITYG